VVGARAHCRGLGAAPDAGGGPAAAAVPLCRLGGWLLGVAGQLGVGTRSLDGATTPAVCLGASVLRTPRRCRDFHQRVLVRARCRIPAPWACTGFGGRPSPR